MAQGHMAEVQAWLEEALARRPSVLPVLRAKALNGLQRAAYFRGYNLARWSDLAEESLVLSAQGDDPYERIQSLAYAYGVQFGLCMMHELWTQPAAWEANPYLSRMESLAAEMLELAQQLEFPQGTVTGLKFQGWVRFLQGDPTAARGYYEAGLRLTQEVVDTEVADMIDTLASVDRAGALVACEQEVARQRALGERESLAQALCLLGELVADGGDLERARELLQEGLALRNKLGVLWNLHDGIGVLHCDLGQIALLQGNYSQALDQLQLALNIFQKSGQVLTIAHIHLFTGLAHLHLGDFMHASGRLRQALSLYRELDAVQFIPYALAALGMLAHAQGQPIRAGRLAGAAVLRHDRSRKWQWFALPSRRLPERLVTALSGLQDDPATAAAWADGQRMSPDEDVEYALSTG
jgi:tetratricopeptide (TPR) repeat protein